MPQPMQRRRGSFIEPSACNHLRITEAPTSTVRANRVTHRKAPLHRTRHIATSSASLTHLGRRREAELGACQRYLERRAPREGCGPWQSPVAPSVLMPPLHRLYSSAETRTTTTNSEHRALVVARPWHHAGTAPANSSTPNERRPKTSRNKHQRRRTWARVHATDIGRGWFRVLQPVRTSAPACRGPRRA